MHHRGDQRVDGSDAEAARRKQNRSAIGSEPVLCAHLLLVLMSRENRIYWNSADRDLLRRYAERLEIHARFFQRDKVAFVMMDQPHRVDVEVRNDDYLPARE